MRIIEEPKEYKIICPKCEAKLGYVKTDIKYKDMGYHGGYDYLECPNCKSEIILKDNTL